MTVMDGFEYPQINTGDIVLVAPDDHQQKIFGIVIEPFPDSAHILQIHPDQPLKVRAYCRYVGDPRIESQPGYFESGDGGVFELAPTEIQKRKLVAQLESISGIVQSLAQRIAKLEAKPTVKPSA